MSISVGQTLQTLRNSYPCESFFWRRSSARPCAWNLIKHPLSSSICSTLSQQRRGEKGGKLSVNFLPILRSLFVIPSRPSLSFALLPVIDLLFHNPQGLIIATISGRFETWYVEHKCPNASHSSSRSFFFLEGIGGRASYILLYIQFWPGIFLFFCWLASCILFFTSMPFFHLTA